MEKSKIFAKIEHTQLGVTATADDYRILCEEAARYKVAAVCVPPAWVKFCRRLLEKSAVRVCTVVGFPFGYDSVETKVYATQQAIMDGADEVDMVVNIGMVLSANQLDDSWLSAAKHEIERVRKVCGDKITLKVIIETCYLNEAQKINLCHAVTNAGANYIKTSTGFGSGGATLHDVALFRQHIGSKVKIKAAGGISTIEDAERFIEAGADRLGSSKLVKLLADEMAVN